MLSSGCGLTGWPGTPHIATSSGVDQVNQDPRPSGGSQTTQSSVSPTDVADSWEEDGCQIAVLFIPNMLDGFEIRTVHRPVHGTDLHN